MKIEDNYKGWEEEQMRIFDSWPSSSESQALIFQSPRLANTLVTFSGLYRATGRRRVLSAA